MAVDWAWMSKGGCLLDSTGDIAFTASPWECLCTMIETRLKAAIDGWKQYQIGADLDSIPGNTIRPEVEITIQRQIESSLSQEFLPIGSFTVSTLPLGNGIVQVFVFIQNQLAASTVVTP